MAASDERGLPAPAEPLLILAMDQRESFGRTLFGVTGDDPSGEQLTAMRSAKEVIFESVRELPSTRFGGPARLGVLVDEQLGSAVARQAKAAGFELAMPVERSGAPSFTFEYGEDFAEHVEAFEPDWVKVLVQFNPDDAPDLQAAQLHNLRRLHDWVRAAGRRWILELLVPPSRAQLAQHEDQAFFDEHARPGLTVSVIGTMAEAGVLPDLWKLEGYQTTEGAETVLAAVAATGADSRCVVLGRNAPVAQVDHWLQVGAPLPGYAGFAIGRTNWNEAIGDHLAGRLDLASTQAAIRGRYEHFVTTYLAADPAV